MDLAASMCHTFSAAYLELITDYSAEAFSAA